MEGVLLESGLDILPASVVEDALLLKSDVDKGGTLGDDLTSTERVVANLFKKPSMPWYQVLVGRCFDGRSPEFGIRDWDKWYAQLKKTTRNVGRELRSQSAFRKKGGKVRNEDLSKERTTEDVSAHLAVAHILGCGETDGRTVGKYRAVIAGTLGSESVHSGRIGDVTSVVLVLDGVLAPAVQDTNKDGLFLGNHGVSGELHTSI